MDDLYNRIDAMAKERGYKNMTALCNAAGIPRATMTELKKGRSKSLLPETARKLANVLNVSLDDIFGITDKQEKTPDAQGDGLTMVQKQLIWRIKNLPEEVANELLAYLNVKESLRTIQDDNK